MRNFFLFFCLLGFLFSDTTKNSAWPVGEFFVDFEAQAVGGEWIDTFKLRQGKVVVLKMGNLQCPHCSRQFAVMGELDTEFEKKGVLFLDITTDENDSALMAHSKKYGADFLTLKDPKASLGTYYGVGMIPVSLVTDKNGKIVFHNEGFVDKKTLIEQIETALKVSDQDALTVQP